MFVQIIQGRTSDQDGLRKQTEAWQRDIQPGADGYLGGTFGVTDDGQFLGFARFASEEAARSNSDRPEQGSWWDETSKLFEGEVTFHDCNEVVEMGSGGSDDAGFVQVIQGRTDDMTALRAAGEEAGQGTARPDVIGGYSAVHGDDPNAFTTVVYFTSEEEARAGESNPDFQADQSANQMQELMKDVHFYDLRNPWMTS
ncbi:MAG: hypothetical protein M3345_00195 [Actinomycetota bacterium]|nr:hypothetical protein [Actinomycetota bacterium]